MAPRKPGKTPQYTPEKLEALKAVESGVALRRAASAFGVPVTTLYKKSCGKSPKHIQRRGGYHSALGREKEDRIVEWIIRSAKQGGFPVTKDGLFDSVENIIAEHPEGHFKSFKGNRPTKAWYYGFLKRHPEVSRKKAEYVHRARGSVTKEKIQEWFQSVTTQLEEDVEVLQHPERVFNMDESGFTLAPQGEFVIGPVGRHVYVESRHSDKENVTTLFAVNAVGAFAPPLTLYKYQRVPPIAFTTAPLDWGIGRSDTGWMTGAKFYEYIGNVFLDFLDEKNIQRPVIVFLDGHSSHLTLHLSKLCKEKGVILVALYPNSTHILQPLDVAVFKPMKTQWRAMKMQWRTEHNGQEISKFDVPKILSKIIKEERMAKSIVSGFRATGLYPFNMDEVDYTKVIERPVNSSDQQIQSQRSRTDFCEFESELEADVLIEFKKAKVSGEWSGDIRDENLFKMWKKKSERYEMESTAKKTSGSESSLVIWPDTEDKTKKRNKEPMPSVLTSKQWIDRHEKIKNEKEKVEDEKREKKMTRERIKQEKELQKEKKKQEMTLKKEKTQENKLRNTKVKKELNRKK